MLRIGFATVYSWRPHVEHAYFLAQLAERAGHQAFFLTCESDLPTCYTRELRGRPAWQECLSCRAGNLRSFAAHHVSSLGQQASAAPGAAHQAVPIAWTQSSASTLGRFESDADYASDEFTALTAALTPAVQTAFEAATTWITTQRLDAVCIFNGRMDATRAIFEAARALQVRVVSMERTWFGDGLQLYPEETCLGLRSVHRLVGEWRSRPLTRAQAVKAASHVAQRFLRQNKNEWRAYNVNAQNAAWPVTGGKRRILLIPSSLNEVWGHPDWQTGWANPLAAYEALIAHLGLAPTDLVLRCHPNWSERIGRRGGEHAERYYTEWAMRRGIHCIPSADTSSTLGLIEQCEAIVVANGSAALEAGILGKQVIGIAPSIYRDAGFRDQVESPAELQRLRLHADLDAAERLRLQTLIPRQTLRFAHTMVYRIPQYTQAVKAETTTRFKYAADPDPARFIELLRTGVLQADDAQAASDESEEDGVLAQIRDADWRGLIDAQVPDEGHYEPVERRLLYRPIDAVRQLMPLGDR